MSHWTNMKTQIRDKEALKKALARMFPEARITENSIVRGYSGNSKKADVVVEAPAKGGFNSFYDLGFTRAQDGTFEAVTDFFGSAKWTGNENQLRQSLTRNYACEVTKSEAEKMGAFVNETTDEDGTIRLSIRQY